MSDPSIAVIIPAAGASRRLGTPKQLVTIDGEPLVRRAVRTAIGAGVGPVIIAIAAGSADVHAAVADLHCEVIPIDDWRDGMSASIRHGVARADAMRCAAAAVTLVDQWALRPDDLSALVHSWRDAGRPMAAADYGDGTIGVPALFGRAVFPRLAALQGDSGARHLLRGAPADAVTRVAMPRASHDLDDLEDARVAGVAEPQASSAADRHAR